MVRKYRSNSVTSKSVVAESTSTTKAAADGDILKQYPGMRRCVIVGILVWIIGIPLPPSLFYSLFSKNSEWLPLVYQSGLFGLDSRQVCAEWTTFSFDKEYYQSLQLHLNLTDHEMFDYLQQWMCVVPPDDDEGYRNALYSFSQDYHPLSDRSDDAVNMEVPAEDNYYAEDSHRWRMQSVYHEVESEPLNL